MIIDPESQWFKEVVAKVVMDLSGVKMDTSQPATPTDDEDVDYGMQPPIPGEEEAVEIINQQLEGII